MDEILGTLEDNAYLFKMLMPDYTVTAGFNNEVGGFDANAWDTQDLGIGCVVDINREVFRMAKCPSEFGVNVKVKVRGGAVNDFIGGKVVKTHEPVCLVKPVFTALRR